MRNRRVFLATMASSIMVISSAAAVQFAQAATATPAASQATDYVVLYKSAGADAAARAAIAAAGGTVVQENAELGYAVVTSTSSSFAGKVDASAALAGAARNRIIGGSAPLHRAEVEQAERLAASGSAISDVAAAKRKPGVTPEPLADQQWDMKQIGATATGSYAKDQGNPGVLVGVIDTGIDGTHPDIRPNFSNRLSRNFVTDLPDIDGPCEHPSCVDPANEDDNEHGTHVASTIASPINGLGIAGVAPKVTLVNIRAGQDSGYFFLEATLKALVYAGNIGVDVVNMSFYTDPWLYNCTDNPADSPAEQAEQRTIREATQRAVNYAIHHGVLPISALGNESTDLGNPTSDDTSPDYPENTAKVRTIDNSCLNVPAETRGVVSVSATGISTRKSYYSNYGTEQTDVAAPGGDTYDTPDNTRDLTKAVLAAYPKNVAEAEGFLNPDGTPNTPAVVRDCKGTVCGYYTYLQGTSMAAPHAVGVAALIVSHYGVKDRRHGGLTLKPAITERLLYATATKHSCPNPRLYEYTRITSAGTVTASAQCDGPVFKNGFYGFGIVNARAAVGGH